MLGKGFSREHAETVGHAMAVHLNYHVPFEEHGDTAFLVTRGAICDVFGTCASQIAEESVKEVFARYPRDELYTVFNDTAFVHLRDTRFEASFRAVRNGEIEVIAHPLAQAPYA